MPTGIYQRTPEMYCSRKGKIAWNKGKRGVYTQDSIEKMRIAHTGKKLSEIHKQKIGMSHLGKKYKPMTEEGKKNISRAHMGHISWNKGKTNTISPETRQKLSQYRKGRTPWNKGKKNIYSFETRQKMSAAKKGRPHTEEWNKWNSERQRGEKSHFWKGGITERNHTERHVVMSTYEYGLWRKSVFTRDSFTCQSCGDNKGGNLHAHHILSFSEFPHKRLDISNGLTLCRKCHIKTHSGKKTEVKKNV